MTTLDTTDDLLRAARENQEFREAFRRELLTEELTELPNLVRQTNANINALTNTVNTLAQSVEKLVGEVVEIRSSHRAEHNSLHRFRGNYAIETTRNSRIMIARLFADVRGISRFRLRTALHKKADLHIK